MDTMDKDSSCTSVITFGEFNVCRLLFADHLALFSLNKSDLQYGLDWFSDACLEAGMKISTAKTVCLGQKLASLHSVAFAMQILVYTLLNCPFINPFINLMDLEGLMSIMASTFLTKSAALDFC